MFDIGIGEMAVLLVGALLIFSPTELPKAVGDAVRFVTRLRREATEAGRQIMSELPVPADLGGDIRSLTPQRALDRLLETDVEPSSSPPVPPTDDAGPHSSVRGGQEEGTRAL